MGVEEVRTRCDSYRGADRLYNRELTPTISLLVSLTMPIHNWTRVGPGVFHDFHNAWITEIRNALNGGVLPADYLEDTYLAAFRGVPARFRAVLDD